MDAVLDFVKFLLAMPLLLCAMFVYLIMLLLFFIVCALMGAARGLSPNLYDVTFKDLEF